MARDAGVLPDIIRNNLAKPGFLESRRVNPVLAMVIEKKDKFELIMHGWLPLPDRRTAISHQSIHHHGNLLLTSVGAFGPGYESILFRPGFEISRKTGKTAMAAEKIYENPLYNIEFVDTDTPHIVFYPPALSITYALWSADRPPAPLVKNSTNLALLQKYKPHVKAALKTFGLAGALGVNVVEYFDFYVDNGAVIAMKDRVKYPLGTHANFAQNLFYFMQATGFDDHNFVAGLPEPTADIHHWKSQFLAGRAIPDLFDPIHLHVSKINLPRQDLLDCFGLEQTPARIAG